MSTMASGSSAAYISSPSGGAASNPPSTAPVAASTELFWSLLDKADRKFSRLRDLPPIPRSRGEGEFQKAFKIYTRLWKLQQELRGRLMEAGLKRWEVGEIASRIAQLYHGQYLRTSDVTYLNEAYIFYEAVLTREYFKDPASPPALVTKQLRFLARFMILCLLLNRREMVAHLATQLRSLIDESKKNFHESEFKEWKHVVLEMSRFLKADSSFMNMRPLRYSFVFDSHPDSFSSFANNGGRRGLVLRDAILSSYHENEVKFTELTLDTFRMLQCLEWEPHGFFSLKDGADINHSAKGPNRVNLLQDIRDLTLPPNPRKVALHRPSATHFLMVLATICEELPADGILLIYLSASGGIDNLDSGVSFPSDGPSSTSLQNMQKPIGTAFLCLGARGSGDLNCLYPCDLIPFTRKPLFLVIDSTCSHVFKEIHGKEKGETSAILLSPISSHPAIAADALCNQNGSHFTMFLTSPVQAFYLLIGHSSMHVDKETYQKLEELLLSSFSSFASCLEASDSLHPVWLEVLGDPFLRRLLLRFIFCRAVIALNARTYRQEEFIPSCVPHLPKSVDPESSVSQSVVMELANFLSAADQFVFSDEPTTRNKVSDVGLPHYKQIMGPDGKHSFSMG